MLLDELVLGKLQNWTSNSKGSEVLWLYSTSLDLESGARASALCVVAAAMAIVRRHCLYDCNHALLDMLMYQCCHLVALCIPKRGDPRPSLRQKRAGYAEERAQDRTALRWLVASPIDPAQSGLRLRLRWV